MSSFGRVTGQLILNKVRDTIKMDVLAVIDSYTTLHFVANNRFSRRINVYQMTDLLDIDRCVQSICKDLVPEFAA